MRASGTKGGGSPEFTRAHWRIVERRLYVAPFDCRGRVWLSGRGSFPLRLSSSSLLITKGEHVQSSVAAENND